MRVFLGIFLVLACSYAFAGAQCDTRAELAGAMTATKYVTIEALKENPGTGPTSEVWRIMAFMSAEEYHKLGDSDEQIAQTTKLIERTSVTADWRIDILVFSEFFRALCEADVDVVGIRSLDGKALGACFGHTPPGRPDFAACIRTEVRAMDVKTQKAAPPPGSAASSTADQN
jgi:hypothetical protein